MERLVYVSESRVDFAHTEQVVVDLVSNAKLRNACLAVTGALIFTGSHFAQILEGPPDSIALILAALLKDPRHSNIYIVAHYPISTRIFAEWQMAYHGPSRYVARCVEQLLLANSQSEQRRLVDRLVQMAFEFC